MELARFHVKLLELTISRVFFYLLIFLLPVQTRKIYFTENSFYFGYHSFYNDFYVYLTDLIVFGLILAWIFENSKISRERWFFNKILTRISQDRIYCITLVFWLILAISTIFSRESILGQYGLTKLAEYFVIFAYIRENFNISRERFTTFCLILATFWIQAGIAVFQYFSQKSLGLKFLGEEYLRPGLKGVAEFVSQGLVNPFLYKFFPYLGPISRETINIRAYGTLPHPNVLAGLLFFGLILNLFLLYKAKFSREIWIFSCSLILLFTGLVLTFSRVAWVVASFGILLWFLIFFWKIRPAYVKELRTGQFRPDPQGYFPGRLGLIIFILLLGTGLNFFLFGRQIQDRLFGVGGINDISSETFVNRNLLNELSFKMIQKNPLLGVGVKNFVTELDNYTAERILPYLHQPVHNIYLLIAAEGGFLALVVFLLFLYNIVRPHLTWSRSIQRANPILDYSFLIIFFGFLAIGLFDHYFWTIQQGSLIFWITAGLLAVKAQNGPEGIRTPDPGNANAVLYH